MEACRSIVRYLNYIINFDIRKLLLLVIFIVRGTALLHLSRTFPLLLKRKWHKNFHAELGISSGSGPSGREHSLYIF